MRPRSGFLALLCGVALAACTPAPHVGKATLAPATRDTHERLNALLWMQTSAEYHVLASTAYREAGARLQSMVKAARAGKFPDSAALEQPGHNTSKLPLAVILDIDETVLDNSPESGRLVQQHAPYTPDVWSAWVAKESAAFVPGAEEFIKQARALGVAVYFVTNRTKDEEQHTINNLAAVGATADEILASKETAPGESAPWASEKKARREFVAKSHWIALLIGDDLGDFIPGIRSMPPDQRMEEAQKYATRFGDQWFLLPNPNYGSWESALSTHDDDAGQLQDKFSHITGF